MEHGAAASPAETYEAFYGFAHGPFSLAPEARCFYRGATHGRALESLIGLIDTGTGCAVVTGAQGTGRTTLARAFVSSLDRKVFAALILNPFLSRDELLREVLLAYGVVSGEDVHAGRVAAASHAELAQTVTHFVRALSSIGGRGVLVIDDAHNLPDDSLEEVVRLSGAAAGAAPLVQVVLLGDESLLAALVRSPQGLLGGREPERLAIAPLSRAELEAYLAYRLAEAGGSTAIHVGAEALDEIQRVTGGVPRLVNLVCDRALLISARERTHDVSLDAVQRAARALNLAGPGAEPDRAPDADAGARPWKWMVPAIVIGIAVVVVAAVAVNVDLRIPPLPGVPHVPMAAPAEAIPAPVTLEFEVLPELRPPAPPVPAFEPQALGPAPRTEAPQTDAAP